MKNNVFISRNLIHEESGNTNFDERRILMMKCQIYQLEKQVRITNIFYFLLFPSFSFYLGWKFNYLYVDNVFYTARNLLTFFFR